jgi:hypothetical protein
MSRSLEDLALGTLYLAAGVVILQNLDAIVRFDQHSGSRLKAWFNRKLGKSVLTHDAWPVGNPSGFRISRIVFEILAVIFLIGGLILVAIAFLRDYL